MISMNNHDNTEIKTAHPPGLWVIGSNRVVVGMPVAMVSVVPNTVKALSVLVDIIRIMEYLPWMSANKYRQAVDSRTK